MISLLQQYKSSLIWFITGCVLAILLSWSLSGNLSGSLSPQVSTPNYQFNPSNEYPVSDFAATHQEPNFY